MDLEPLAASLEEAAALLPCALRRKVAALPLSARARAEELRLRVGQPLFVLYPEGETPIAGTHVTADTLETVLEIASGASVHTVMEQVRHGFVPVKGGHRLGLCGAAVLQNGALSNLRELSSLSIRVAHAFPGIAALVVPKLWSEGELESTLILSPPGGGKTTLLRDLIRCISSGENCQPRRVGLVDERFEVAGMADGAPTLEVGPRTDVLSGCPKALGLTMLLRGMNPQVAAVDEITAPEDAAAMIQTVGCGVTLLATAHAAGLADLDRRPLYQELMKAKIFGRVVVISGQGRDRRYTVTDPEGRPC